MEHTQGPWTTDGHLVGYVMVGDAPPVNTVIAEVHDGRPYHMQDTDDDTRRANAQLIASAPDLLETVKRDIGCLYSLLQLVRDNYPELVKQPEFIEAKRAEQLGRAALTKTQVK